MHGVATKAVIQTGLSVCQARLDRSVRSLHNACMRRPGAMTLLDEALEAWAERLAAAIMRWLAFQRTVPQPRASSPVALPSTVTQRRPRGRTEERRRDRLRVRPPHRDAHCKTLTTTAP